MKLPVSVVMIARNEESQIGRAMASVQFAEDVVVIDALSNDKTAEIASAAGARVIQRAWTNFSDQRNFSLREAKCDWVLVLDADEAVSPALVQWLENFFREGKDKIAPHGYKIKRTEFFIGQRIYGACWNPSFQDRFFRRSKANYIGEIHEYPLVEGGFVYAPETAVLEHNPNVTAESFFEKMNRYTTIEAFDRYQAGQRTSLFHLGVAFFATWWKNFFYYGGYRDGAHGFVICLMEGVSRTVRHIKLWQIQQLAEQGRLGILPDPRKAMDLAAASHRKLEAKPVAVETK
ncbi:MAG: glycosyltransferase family 2 protein [Bdellovibrionota bacterium]